MPSCSRRMEKQTSELSLVRRHRPTSKGCEAQISWSTLAHVADIDSLGLLTGQAGTRTFSVCAVTLKLPHENSATDTMQLPLSAAPLASYCKLMISLKRRKRCSPDDVILLCRCKHPGLMKPIRDSMARHSRSVAQLPVASGMEKR